jgi:hypothetical protein
VTDSARTNSATTGVSICGSISGTRTGRETRPSARMTMTSSGGRRGASQTNRPSASDAITLRVTQKGVAWSSPPIVS